MPIPEEKYYAPVGAYNFSIDENGQFAIVPTYRASRTVTVTKPEEYINPEFIVTPRSVKPLVDDTGKPTYSVDAYNIVQDEKHKPLNPYQYYMESKGVAPKDVEAEHLIQRHRGDQAAEKANLSPFIANLLTGMYATAAQEGWNNIKNGNYFTGAAEVLSPLMFGENIWNKVAQGVYGGIHLLNENGIPKTWEEIKKGNYGRAALSGAGDLFNLTLAGVGGNQVYRSALGRLNSSKGTTIGSVRGIEGTSTATEIEISPEELYKLLQEQEGYYFLGHGTGRKPSGVSEAIFNSGLRVKDGDVLNTTIPLSESNLANWPHLNSEEVIILPGRVENMKYDYPYGRIPSDWFDTNTFHWNDNPGFSGRGLMAQENPHASFTESVVGGIPGVYTKPEAVLGSYNTRTHILRINPNSQYRFSFGENVPDIKSFSGPSGQLAPRPVNYLSTNPQENPLLSRMMRLSEKRQVGDVAPNQTAIFRQNVSPHYIVRVVSERHPELNSNQIKQITQTLMNNKRGAHIPIGNNAGETTGGISIVEVEDAINYLKSKGIKNPTERDIRIMFGHELGHGVKLTPEALNAVRGYEAPEEFYTQIGQVLDSAGITSTQDMPVQFNDLLKLGEKYLAEGNLDNGVSKALNFLKRFKGNSIKDIIKQQNIMKLINRFSVGILGIYTGSQLANNNGKVQ